MGTGVSEGDVPPQKGRKIVIFKVNSHDLVHSFCLGCPHKVRRPISAKNRGGARRLRPPLNPLYSKSLHKKVCVHSCIEPKKVELPPKFPVLCVLPPVIRTKPYRKWFPCLPRWRTGFLWQSWTFSTSRCSLVTFFPAIHGPCLCSRWFWRMFGTGAKWFDSL